MDREELTAVYNALNALLGLSDDMLEQVAKWISPATAKGNGHDPDPLPAANGHAQKEQPLRQSPAPYVGKIRRGRPKTSAKTAERKLLEAMQANPGLSVIALANAAGSSRSATGERLRRLALTGKVEKDHAGRWKLKAEKEPGERSSEELRPTGPA